MPDKEILSLETLNPQRKVMRIDGEAYEIATRDDFGPRSYAKLHKYEVLQVLAQREIDTDNLSEETAAQIELAVNDLVQVVLLGIPPEVVRRLKVGHKARILEVFQQETDLPVQLVTRQKGASRLLTGGRSSQGSNASTGEIPTGG